MSLLVAISTVADGSMYNRNNHDDPNVVANREAFLKKHGLAMDQTTHFHPIFDFEVNDFCRYEQLGPETMGQGMAKDNFVSVDALFTTNKDHAIFLPIADCIGAVLYDPEHHVFGVAHLGRHSLEQQGGEKLIAYMKGHYESTPESIKVWLTPAPSKAFYPIWALDNKGMKEVAFEQLHTAGIVQENITDTPVDSDTDPRYFSYSAHLRGVPGKDGDYSIVAMMTD